MLWTLPWRRGAVVPAPPASTTPTTPSAWVNTVGTLEDNLSGWEADAKTQ